MNHPEFKVHLLNDEGISKAREIAKLFNELLTELETIVPTGREMAITKTKLEEACFFAKKGMAAYSQNQKNFDKDGVEYVTK